MVNRREFLQVAMSIAAGASLGMPWSHAAARQAVSQDSLLEFDPLGQVTLLHFTDIHAQLVPLYFREPSVNLGVGAVRGEPPHLTQEAFLWRFSIEPGSSSAYALSSEDFASLAKAYGKVGGIDRLATVVQAIKAERPGKTLLLDSGDTWQGSLTSLRTQGTDMVRVMNALGVEAMSSHWEFTYGTERVMALVEQLDFPFLAGNIVDTEWEEEVFEAIAYFERGGVNIAVVGQAFPYTPVANPRYKIPNWSFGIRENKVREHVARARENGAQLVVLLSHNGFDVDRKLAGRVDGIDVILTGHTHDAIPVAVEVGKCLLVASGSHGKFLSRLDLDVGPGGVKDFSFKLIPILADVIAPATDMAETVTAIRAPFAQELSTELARTETLLYRRGNFNGTFDDLICHALREERDAQIALSPGFRWGGSLLPGDPITVEDVYNQTAITYPNAYRIQMTGEQLKAVLEDVADNLFNPDPYYQQGGDMVRVGGLGYRIDVNEAPGKRISEMTLLDSGAAIGAQKQYTVAGWASVNPDTEGPPIYDVVAAYLQRKKTVAIEPNTAVKMTV
ncbi:MAG: thiosulfohydrolase SoxB [Gammaproteobacteria bacterium]|nr:thiosulfohydrolase SoxB [Gammaproteobacteria bacterium]